MSKNAFRDHRTTSSKSPGSLHRNELGRSQPGFRHLRRFRPRDPAVVVQIPRRDNQVRAFSLGAGDVAVVVRIRFRGGFGHFYGDGFELARDAARVLNGEWTLVRAKRRFRCVSKRISFVSQKSVHRAQRVNTDPEATSRVGQSTGAARDEKKYFFSVLQSRWFLSPCNSRTQHTVSPNRHAAVGSQPGERRRRVVQSSCPTEAHHPGCVELVRVRFRCGGARTQSYRSDVEGLWARWGIRRDIETRWCHYSTKRRTHPTPPRHERRGCARGW